MDLQMLKTRALIIQKVRSFFLNKGYLELDTPLLSRDLIPESCLEVFRTERLYPAGSRRENHPLWLIPSPEIWMKKIISQHRVNVFQICKCFRNGEQDGRLHNSEFTMLEYYTMDADYMDSLSLTEELFLFLTAQTDDVKKNECFNLNGLRINNRMQFERITVSDAFKKYAGFDLFEAAGKGAENMAEKARELGLDPARGMTVQGLYDLIFIHAVEPNLNMEKPAALLDYPAFVPCLAKKSGQGSGGTVERWELYYKGIELANCFSEETDPQKIKEFFINEEAEKNRTAIVKHRVDHDYWKMFEEKASIGAGQGFPQYSGVAMGLDRLIMILTGRLGIDSVLPFPEE